MALENRVVADVSPRSISPDGTVIGTTSAKKHGAMPDVDLVAAAALKPSRLRGRHLMFMVTFVAGTGFTMFGYDQGVLSSLLTLDSFAETFPQAGGSFSTLQSFMVAIYQIGCMVGALLNLYVGDKLGRKKTIAWGGIGIIAGTVLQTAAVNYEMMCVARVFNGIFNGLLTSTVPSYQSECAKPHQRGPLVILSGTLIGFGIMCSYWVGLGFYYTSGDIQWRFPIAFQSIFTIIMLACMWIWRLPESPRWLVGRGRHTEAIAVLAALDDKPVDDPEVLDTWKAIVDSANQSEGDFAFRELFHHGRVQHFRRTCLGVLVQCFQQISGCNLITYYLTSVLDDMGMGPEMSRVIAGVNGTCYFLTSIIAIFIIERVGRRPLMLWCALGMGVTMVLLAGLYIETSHKGNSAAQAVSVLCLFVFNCFFTIGWLGMSWLYPAEVTPIRIRAPANALSTASNWLFNFYVVMQVPALSTSSLLTNRVTGPMFEQIGWGTYAFFAAMNIVIILPTVYFLFPETTRRSLEDVDLIFAVANAVNRSPVKVAAENNTPKAGTVGAERVLGRAAEVDPVGMQVKKRFEGTSEARQEEV